MMLPIRSALTALLLTLLSCSTPTQEEQPPLQGQPPPQEQPNTAVIPESRDGGHGERHEKINAEVQSRRGAVDLVFVGDSITQGWEKRGKEIWDQRYASRRAVNLGISGDRTEHVLWRLENGNLDGIAPKVAVVMIGTNNFGHGTHGPEAVLSGVRAVVASIRAKCPTTTVLLLDIFPRGERFNAMRGDILQVNQALQRLHDGEHVICLSIGYRFIEDDGSIRAEIMPDRLHLSEEGYRIWADAMEATLKKLLGE